MNAAVYPAEDTVIGWGALLVAFDLAFATPIAAVAGFGMDLTRDIMRLAFWGTLGDVCGGSEDAMDRPWTRGAKLGGY